MEKKIKWTQYDLEKAMQDVKSGKSIRGSARNYGIPYSSLKLRIDSNDTSKPKFGRQLTFTTKQETELVDHYIHLAKIFYGLTRLNLRKIAYEFAEQNNVKNTFNKKKKTAGLMWVWLFLKRHPDISIRKSEENIAEFKKCAVVPFFKNLNYILVKHKFQPHQIYNVDEINISAVPTPNKIDAPEGVTQLGEAINCKSGHNITVICAISATGHYIPPMFIFPKVRQTSDQLCKNGPVDAIYECSSKGRINNNLFVMWLKHFVKITCVSKNNPLLLLLDNHKSHITLSSYNFCRENGVIILSFPPNTSHKLQPLDLTVYGPLKKAYSNQCDLFLKNNGNKKIKLCDVAGIFNDAFIKIATKKKAKKGFKTSGIVPYNHNIFEDFSPALIEPQEVDNLEIENKNVSTINTNIILCDEKARTSKTNITSVKKDVLSSTKISFEQISPLHVKKFKVTKKNGKIDKSKVLIASPEKEDFVRREINEANNYIKCKKKKLRDLY